MRIPHTTNLQRLKERYESSITLNKQDPNYQMINKVAANCLRSQLKKISEKHSNQELKSITKMLTSFASKKEEHYRVDFTETGLKTL